MTQHKGDVEAAIEALREMGKPITVTGELPKGHLGPTNLLVPKGYEVYDLTAEIDARMPAPSRIRGTATAETLDSFVGLVTRHQTAESVIFARGGTAPSLTAVVDYHGASSSNSGSTPAWGEHRIAYEFPVSAELSTWRAACQFRRQGGFAAFLDERRFDLVDPLDVEGAIVDGTAAHRIMLRSVPREDRPMATPNAVFASPAKLAMLVESLTGKANESWSEVKTDRFGGIKLSRVKEGRVDGDETIPHLFLVEAPIFVGGDKVVFPARIQAKVDGGLWLKAELIDVDRVLEAGFVEAIAKVYDQTKCPVVRGQPEAR